MVYFVLSVSSLNCLNSETVLTLIYKKRNSKPPKDIENVKKNFIRLLMQVLQGSLKYGMDSKVCSRKFQ